MADNGFYTSPGWRHLRAQVLARDNGRCTVARLLGGSCSGALHVHHLEPVAERPDLALDPGNCGTACARHHSTWEAVRRAVVGSRRANSPSCPHRHPYPEGRLECERRRARQLAA